MKKRHSIHLLLAAAALLLATAACTKNELADDDRLPEGQYPLEIARITLGVEGGEAQPWGTPATRVSENGDGNSSKFDADDKFAVQIDGEGEVGTYTVQNDGSVEAENPLYWSDRDEAHTVTAWYPATDGTLDLSDQQTNGLAYLLSGTGTGDYQTPVTLNFTHALAKVRITPSDDVLGEVQSLQLHTYTQCTYEKGNAGQGSQEGWIEMKKCEYTENDVTITCWEANVVPGYAISKLRANGTEERDLSSAFTPEAGKVYNITLEKDKGYTIDENGTYIVYSEEGLRAWAGSLWSNPSLSIILTADITLTPPADGGSNWNPINTYQGTFDGGGHTISGLVIKGNSTRLGFFQFLKSATVKNLTLENVQITNDFSWDGMSYVGGVAGENEGSVIENCFVSGSVIGNAIGKWSKSCVGGVAGRISNAGTVYFDAIGCGTSATVKGHNRVGGVAGEVILDNVASCYATGSVTLESKVTDDTYIGGVVGYCYDSFISGCYATGSVTGSGSGTIYVGGVLGTSLCATLNACYHAQGKVSGPNGTTGGVLGQNILDSYFGGGVLNVCYWENNGQEKGIGTNEGGTVLEATKVDGTTVTWQTAIEAMNAKLDWLRTGWHYELKDGNRLPTLKKL